MGHTMNTKFKKKKDFEISIEKLPLKLQKLREEKEEAFTSAFRVGYHLGTDTA